MHQGDGLEVVEVHLPVAGDQRHPADALVGVSHDHASKAVIPGSCLPSRYSSDAPPPVEMCEKVDSSSPRARTAAAESPPPTTLMPSTAATAWATCGCRWRTARARRRPSGRSRTPSWRRRAPRRTARPTRGRCRGPSGRRGSCRPARSGSAASAENSAEVTMSVGSTSVSRVVTQEGRAGLDLVLLEQRVADVVALRLQEREAHAAADEQLVHLGSECLDDAELVRDLGPAEHDHVGPYGVGGQRLEHVDLGRDQTAGGVRQLARDVVDAGVLAVHGAEAIADVEVEPAAEADQLVGERGTLVVVLAGLAGLVAEVLDQSDLAVAEPRRDLVGRAAHHVGGEGHRLAEQLRQPYGDRVRGRSRGWPRPWAGPDGRRRRPGRRRRAARSGSAGWPGSGRHR